jgi:hypothetical protein
MTYAELATLIAALTPAQAAMDVTIHNIDEDRYYDFNNLKFAPADSFLNEGNPVIAFGDGDELPQGQ